MSDQLVMSGQLLAQLDAVYANATRLVRDVPSDRWRADTPCTEWNVRQLVNHMGFTTRLMEASAARRTPEAAPDDDHVGRDGSGFADLAEAAVAAWHAAGALDGDVEIPVPMPAVAALSINLLDIGIHCWDLAQATGQPHGVTGEQVALIDAIARGSITDDVRDRFGFGPALSPTDDTPLATMLAFVGRHP